MSEISGSPFYHSGKFSGKRVHFGICGSIACYKTIELMRALQKIGVEISVALSHGARKFLSPLLFQALGARTYGEMFDSLEEAFAHLEPGQICQAMAIAPASADMLAKVANGFASDMVSGQALAFSGPILAAPAMNPKMWKNPATQANVESLKKRGITIIEPGSGGVACGETGEGRLADIAEIFFGILKLLTRQDLEGLKVLITLGPTRERWDGARFWSNPSSGLMGSALSTAAWIRGAEVSAICGPGSAIYLPSGVKRIDVESADEMFESANDLWPEADWGIFSAAVADYAPERPPEGDDVKFHKSDGALIIEMRRTRDILATLAKRKTTDQKILGFAAEIAPDMDSLLAMAQKKLLAKNADLLAANLINRDGAAFGASNVGMAVADRNGVEEIWPKQPKADAAWDLCSWLLKL